MEAAEDGKVLVAIGKMQVEIKSMDKKLDEISKLSNQVQITEQSVKSAHNRIEELKTDMLERFRQHKDDYTKELIDVQKDFDKEMNNIRKEYDKEMLKQDEKWQERLKSSRTDWQNELKPFIEKQKKDNDRNGKIQTALISWVLVSSLSGILFLIRFFA